MTLVRAQWSKNNSELVLHADPSSWSTAGFQRTDFLRCLGFTRYESCSFHGKCYARVVPPEFTLGEFQFELRNAYEQMTRADGILYKCGVSLPQKEGWGYFNDKPSVAVERENRLSGNGHDVLESTEIKRSEDHAFEYRLTFVKDRIEKGFVTHYRVKPEYHQREYGKALRFLGCEKREECPEYDFEPCCYTTLKTGTGGQYRIDADTVDFNGLAHRTFDAHADEFASGVELIVSANKCLSGFGITLWDGESIASDTSLKSDYNQASDRPNNTPLTAKQAATRAAQEYEYDVALSFAGPDRRYAKELHDILKKKDISVFYDQGDQAFIWGKYLAPTLYEIFNKMARYCVVFVSREYRERRWTMHELRSALDRAVNEKGSEYILPIRIDDTQLEGLSSSISYLSIDEGIEPIATILIDKIRNSKKT